MNMKQNMRTYRACVLVELSPRTQFARCDGWHDLATGSIAHHGNISLPESVMDKSSLFNSSPAVDLGQHANIGIIKDGGTWQAIGLFRKIQNLFLNVLQGFLALYMQNYGG